MSKQLCKLCKNRLAVCVQDALEPHMSKVRYCSCCECDAMDDWAAMPDHLMELKQLVTTTCIMHATCHATCQVELLWSHALAQNSSCAACVQVL